MDMGLTLSPESAAGFTVSWAVSDCPLRVAVTVAVVRRLTPLAVAVNVAVVWPAGTVTFNGTATDPELLDKATSVPPIAPGPLIVTVPTEVEPALIDVGLNEINEAATGIIVKAADFLLPRLAEIFAVVLELTPPT